MKRIASLEATIDSLVTDANRVVKFYQQYLQEMTEQQEQVR
jgi:hypothetical protein